MTNGGALEYETSMEYNIHISTVCHFPKETKNFKEIESLQRCLLAKLKNRFFPTFLSLVAGDLQTYYGSRKMP